MANKTGIRPILSISILTYGRGELQKSLDSLHYFKNAFPCEIILVDTGCNPEQRALVERYADKVIEFAWCNDFAAARNAGLKEARGEWFMFLDDDEWFDNPQEIINFFLTGEYKNFNSASYVVRNYLNEQGSLYEDSYPSRMVKLEPGCRFHGKIHEFLDPFKPPSKAFTDFVHHYGYVYKDEADRKRHAHRNIEPLLEMREEHPGDPRWFCQLAQEYFSIKEYRKVVECCRTGLEEWHALEDQGKYAPVFVGAAYGFILISLDSLNAFDEEEEWLEKAFTDPLSGLMIMEPTVAFYCLAGARLYSQTKNYPLCRDYFKRYIDYARRLKGNRERIELGTAAVVAGVFQEQLLYGTILMCMGAVIRMEEYELAVEAFYLLDWDDKRLLRQEKWEKDMLDACCCVEYHPAWKRILQTLTSRQEGMKEMHVVFLETEIEYRKEGENEKLARLHRLVAGLDHSHYYVLCTKVLWAAEDSGISSQKEQKEKAAGLLDQLFGQYPEKILEIRAEVLDAAEQLEISMEPLLLRMDYRTWKRQLERWCREASLQNIRQWDERMAVWKRQPDIRYDLFSTKCLEGYLRNYRDICPESSATEKIEQLEKLLWAYADCVVAYYKNIYQESVFRDKPVMLPDEAQLGLQLIELRQCRKRGDIRGTLVQLRKCLDVYPELEPAVGEYAKLCRDEIQQQNKEAETAQAEFLRLVQSLKMTARQCMEKGDFLAAREILRQVQKCVPKDEEVRKLLKQTAG